MYPHPPEVTERAVSHPKDQVAPVKLVEDKE